MAAGQVNAITASGERMQDCLGDERVALFLPTEDLKSYAGSYHHLRAAAHHICSAELRTPLPAEWQDVHEGEIEDASGKAFRKLPKVLRQNMSFTMVSFRDPHINSKVFVTQHPYGTGSYRSTLDCVSSRRTFRASRFWSFDGAFQDGTP